MPTHSKPRRRSSSVVDDWGKTKPFWCLTCGMGFGSPERTLKHMAEARHQNESTSIGSRGLSKKQQLEAFRLRNK